ncbi:VanZ family protein [Maribellus maritimus]|uniref:VanZ family protein n=1 Tax=Maribellus maritimus TaxID=2870838 RepID=UPI001EEB1AF4|nr:VanZ family protein [Maribellus maritimus]MCG6190736.1 VanZ family protein [Maribellus maritimus]
MKITFFIKPFIWLALICYGLFLPAKDLPVKPLLQIPHFDKMVHFGLFFIFSLLLFRPFKKLGTRYLLWAPLTAILLSGFLESIQRTISATRSSNIYDFIANMSGILFSIVAFQFFISGKKWEKFF